MFLVFLTKTNVWYTSNTIFFHMFSTLPFQLFIAVLVGAAIGLQRESGGHGDKIGSAGGIRTFSLVSLLGALAGYFYASGAESVFLFLTILFGGFVLAYYILGTYITKWAGLTNELSIVYCFLIGFLLTTPFFPIQLILALLVALLLILSLKSKTRRLAVGISQSEIESFISYAIIALVIFPFLPNQSIHIQDIPFVQTMLNSYQVDLGRFAGLELFNPKKLWFIVVLVTGIEVFGYILGKLVGDKKSFTLTSFVAGFISSTSTTQSLAQKSKKSFSYSLVGAAVLANMASFFQVFLLVGPLNGAWLVSITPTLFFIIVASACFSLYFLWRKDDSNPSIVQKSGKAKGREKIFSLRPAVQFALLLIAVKFVTKICLILFGKSGFIISSVIASFAGIDAIVVNLADMAGNAITFQTALITFVLVNATNLFSKSFYAFLQGHRKFAYTFFVSVIGIVAASLGGFLFM